MIREDWVEVELSIICDNTQVRDFPKNIREKKMENILFIRSVIYPKMYKMDLRF